MNHNVTLSHPAIDKYEALDISIDGPIAQNLLARAEQEAKSNPITLVDRVDTTDAGQKLQPANLTPNMKAWLSRVGNVRSAALDSIGSMVDRIDDATGVHGIFLERQQAKISCQSMVDKRRIVHQHREKHSGDYQRLSEGITDYDGAKRRYEQLRARHDREAKVPPALYWFALGLVGGLEIIFNFETIEGFDYSPFATFALTAILALILTFSSHMHGTFLKQYQAHFGAHAKDGDKMAALRMFSLGTLGLVVVLGVVLYARNRFFADQLIDSLALGNAAPGWWSIVAGSLSGNVGIWSVGVMIAFMAHDRDHHFQDASIYRRKSEKKLRALQRKLDNPAGKDFTRIDAETEIALEQAKNQSQSFSNTPLYVECKQALARVRSKDSDLIFVLETYRQLLLENAPDDVVIELPADLPFEEKRLLTKGEYASLPLALTYS